MVGLFPLVLNNTRNDYDSHHPFPTVELQASSSCFSSVVVVENLRNSYFFPPSHFDGMGGSKVRTSPLSFSSPFRREKKIVFKG